MKTTFQVECQSSEKADELLDALKLQRRKKWVEQTENLNAIRSSRSFWATLRKFGAATCSTSKKQSSVSSNKIASRLIQNSNFELEKARLNVIKKAAKSKIKSLQPITEMSEAFSMDELNAAINEMKIGKAAGVDGIYMEFIKNLKENVKNWILVLYSNIINFVIMPKEFKKAIEKQRW